MAHKFSPETQRLARAVRDLDEGRFDVPLSRDGLPAREAAGQRRVREAICREHGRPAA